MSPRPSPDPADVALERLRAACFGFPAVEEKTSHGAPTFFVRGKMFASFADDHHGDGRTAAWIKAAPEEQQELVGAARGRYFVPPYVGVKGWVGAHLDAKTDWDAVTVLLENAWTSVAPKSAREAPVLPPPPSPPLAKTDPQVAESAYTRIAAICGRLGDVDIERDKWNATFRVKKKPFLYFLDNHHGDGVIGVWVKVEAGTSADRVAENPKAYFVPAYLGARGWLGVRVDLKSVDWRDVSAKITESYAAATAATPAKKRTKNVSPK